MNELPLFPLNTVLFPGTPLPLHIFEPRYIQMITECIQSDSKFGVVLIKRGRESLGPIVDTFHVGTTANIVQVEELDGGRLNIVVVGEERFEVLEYNDEADHLVGTVKNIDPSEGDVDMLYRSSERLRPWVRNYVNLLMEINEIPPSDYVLPQDPIKLAYAGAYMLQIPPRQKQALLEFQDGLKMLEDLRRHFRQEISLVKNLMESPYEFSGNLEARYN